MMPDRLLMRGLEIQEAVGRDGLPRVAQANDGTQDVMYLADGAHIAQSMSAAEWLAQRGPLPADPTQAEIDAALAQRDAERQKRQAMSNSLRGAANAHRGKTAALLTLPEMRDIMALWMDEKGLLDADGKIRAG